VLLQFFHCNLLQFLCTNISRFFLHAFWYFLHCYPLCSTSSFLISHLCLGNFFIAIFCDFTRVFVVCLFMLTSLGISYNTIIHTCLLSTKLYCTKGLFYAIAWFVVVSSHTLCCIVFAHLIL
jgi:hypothetical protein